MKQNETLLWVIYDIHKNKPRTKLAQLLLQSGLYRVQKSVFLGTIEKNRLDELRLEMDDLIDPQKDSVYIFPMCQEDFGKIHLLGQAFNKELVANQLSALFV